MLTRNLTIHGWEELINQTSLTLPRTLLPAAWVLDLCTLMTPTLEQSSTMTLLSSLLASPCSSATIQMLSTLQTPQTPPTVQMAQTIQTIQMTKNSFPTTEFLLNHGPTHLSSITNLPTQSLRMVLSLVIYSMKRATASASTSRRKPTKLNPFSMKVSKTLVPSDCEPALFKLWTNSISE